ncbi:MAG: SIS domain-containing protein [bacterium]
MSAALAERVAERERVARAFFGREAPELARACHAMARAFARGGALIPFGSGPAATDAAHAAVEFVHPVIVGKRALPAVAPSNDPTGLSTLDRLARPGDIVLAISHDRNDPTTAALLDRAHERGLLTIGLTAGPGSDGDPPSGPPPGGDHAFAVPSDDPAIVQEVQETAYHVLWELVHVFFEQPGLLEEHGEACITCGDVAVEATVVEVNGATATIEDGAAREQIAVELIDDVAVGDRLLCHAGVALERVERGSAEPADRGARNGDHATDFLYPFQRLEKSDGAGLDSVLADVEASTHQKAEEVIGLRARVDLDAVARCGAALRERLEAGGRLIAFGNGGSATDAQDLAADALAGGRHALALGNDVATVTAVANDVGFEQIFARQLIALGTPDDVAVAISTSGGSPNLITALEEAHRQGMLTIGLAGYDGGRLAELDWLDHLFVVGCDHIPRIQEAQATIYHLMLEAAR